MLDAKEEGISLCRIFTRYASDLKFSEIISAFLKFVSNVGWDDACRDLFNALIANNEIDVQLSYLIRTTETLLLNHYDSALGNEAAVQVFQQLLSTLTAKVDSLSVFEKRCVIDFLFVILLLDSRRLLSNAEQLVALAASYIVSKPITPNSHHHDLVILINMVVFYYLSFEQLSERLKSLLVSLCSHFLQFDVHSMPLSKTDLIEDWTKLFGFVGRRPLLQELADKICSRPSSFKRVTEADKQLIQILKILSCESLFKKAHPNLKAIRGQMKRTYQILVKRNRYEIRQSVSYLETLTEHDTNSFKNGYEVRDKRMSQLRSVVDLVVNNPQENFSEEEAEEECVSISNLLKTCCKLKSKEEGMRLLKFYSSAYGPKNENLIRPAFLSQVADFINFTDDWENTISKFIFSNLLFHKFHHPFTTNSLKLQIVLIQEMMRNITHYCRHAVFDVFKNICFNIYHYPHRTKTTIPLSNIHAKIVAFLSSLDEQHRQIFYHVVLLLEDRNIFISFPQWIQKAHIPELIMSHMESTPIDGLNQFVALLFEDYGTLTAYPSDVLGGRCLNLLTNFCSRFVEYIRFSLSSVFTKDLLNWIRLIVYIESPHHLQWLMENLCFNAAPEVRDGASLRKLLANEEFQSDNKFKKIREHPILAEWKRQQQKKSFAILFSRRGR